MKARGGRGLRPRTPPTGVCTRALARLPRCLQDEAPRALSHLRAPVMKRHRDSYVAMPSGNSLSAARLDNFADNQGRSSPFRQSLLQSPWGTPAQFVHLVMFTKYSIDNIITKRIMRVFSLRGAFLENDLEAERGCGKCANLRNFSEIIPATVRRWRTATGLTTRCGRAKSAVLVTLPSAHRSPLGRVSRIGGDETEGGPAPS